MLKGPFQIDVDSLNWRAVASSGDTTDCLLATLAIGSINMHLEAFAVTVDDDGDIVAANDAYESDLEGICKILEGQPMTTTIDGREYVLRAVPYQR